MKPVKTHTFHGRRYYITTEPLCGSCTTYKRENELFIQADLNKRVGLITAIHECLHAENWAASEEVVERVSAEIGSFLWRLGYRRKE